MGSYGERTRQEEENQPVHHEHRPEHGDVEDLKPGAHEADKNGPGSRVPELELGEPSDERAEFVIPLGGQGRTRVTVLQTFILGEGRVELGLQEGEEEVQEINAQRVCDYNTQVRRVLAKCSRNNTAQSGSTARTYQYTILAQV